MTESQPTPTDVEPFEVVRGSDETGGEFVRVEYTAHPPPDAPRAGDDLSHARWAADQNDEHVNPNVEEVFEVLSGELTVVVEGDERLLTEGEAATIPGDRPHRHWNSGDAPARVRYEARPARDMDEVLETVFALAQAGETDEQGLPNLLQLAVIQSAYPGRFYPTDLPVGLQRALFAALAPIGRLAGYRATYSRADVDDLRERRPFRPLAFLLLGVGFLLLVLAGALAVVKESFRPYRGC